MITNSFTSLIIAFLLGLLIGVERQYRQRTAGLRTHLLVTVGAASFVNLALTLLGDDGAVRVIAYVVSGIGFLGAGVIMRQEGSVQGLNTSATIWCAGSVGAAAGAGAYSIAFMTTILVLAINICLRPVVNFIDRRPVGTRAEITHNINIISKTTDAKVTISKMREVLRRANIQMLDFNISEFGSDEILIKAILDVTYLSDKEMDGILAELNNSEEVNYAFCSLM